MGKQLNSIEENLPLNRDAVKVNYFFLNLGMFRESHITRFNGFVQFYKNLIQLIILYVQFNVF